MIPFIYIPSWSQIQEPLELGRFEYSILPDLGDTDLRRYSLNVTGGKQIKSGSIGLGLAYSLNDFTFFNASRTFDKSLYGEIHTISTNIFYKHNVNSSWSLNISVAPTLSSNFKNGLNNEDFVFNTSVTASKRWETDSGFSVLSFGILYGTILGEPQFLPAVSFRKIVNEKWGYHLGIPLTGVHYTIDERHSFLARASFSGLYGNNSENTTFMGIGDFTNTKLSYRGVDLGLEHNYRIQPNLTTVIRIGYVLADRLEVLDEDNNLLYDFEPNNSVYLTMGLKFNLNKKMNENDE